MTKSASASTLRLWGVRHNNLKNFDLELPLRRLIVITGPSGSGKSSLAFDTLFAEGQRRYIETFSPYARQFFDRMDKPQVDRIEGIPPAIAIEQRNAVRTTRSTVGTMTEICDYLRLLWPHVTHLHCRQCGRPVRQDSPQRIWQTLLGDPPRALDEVAVTFDLPLTERLSLTESLALVAKQGYQRLLAGGRFVRIEEAEAAFARQPPARETLTVVQDRLRLTSAHRARFVEACEQAYHFGQGKLAIHPVTASATAAGAPTLLATVELAPAVGSPRRFSNRLHCAECDLEYREPSPALFSFNHPVGACPACKGFGRIISIDYTRALPDRTQSLAQGAVKPWQSGMSAECQQDLLKFCRAREVPVNVPFHQLSSEHQRWVIDGDADYGIDAEHEWPRAWYGIRGYFRWLESKAYKMHVRVLLSRYRSYQKCPTCDGRRLQPDALLYRLPHPIGGPLPSHRPRERAFAAVGAGPGHGLTLADFYALPIRDALGVIDELATTERLRPGDPLGIPLQEVRARLGYLAEVGLGYLTLDRPTRTLSGGETERVNLTTCLGTRLVNTLFVLDEPSVGLHPRDTARLIRILERLRDTGNTVVVVEHEAAVIRAADQVVDLGPGHGESGGQIVFQGSGRQLLRSAASLTGQYLSGRKRIPTPVRRAVSSPAPACPEPETAWALADALPTRPPAPLAGQAWPGPMPCAWLTLAHATCHNLHDVTVEIPLGRFVCVTGVSGSGKTTLVKDVLLPALRDRLQTAVTGVPAATTGDGETGNDDHDPTSDSTAAPELELTGADHFGAVVLVDQSALGKTPRSNPAVYIGAFDDIREAFAQTETARQRGLTASAFSFNSAAGQCERCRGAGFEKIEMQFLSDVFIRCPECDGRRYRPEILEVKVTGASRQSWSIADVLDATVDEAVGYLKGFADSAPARRAAAKLGLLQEVGLGYVRLGQPINTLSGGESQRLKLVSHLAESEVSWRGEPPRPEAPERGEKVGARRRGVHESTRGAGPADRHAAPKAAPSLATSGRTFFLFDEPTTGLHFDDVRVLLQVFHRLTDAGHSVLVVEHNVDVIRCADWVIDLGPEAGDEGGRVVAVGTPETIASCAESHTGRALRAAGLGGTTSPS